MKRIRCPLNGPFTHMRQTYILPFGVLVALGACNEFPELDESVDSAARDAVYPDLVPIETITAGVAETQIEPETEEDLEERVDRLKARAKRLKRGSVVDKATQRRMESGIEPVSE